VTPVLILTFAIWSWVEAGPITTGDYTFPEWSNILGQMLSCSSLLGIFGERLHICLNGQKIKPILIFDLKKQGWMIYEVVNALYFDKKPLIELIKPSKEWRPLLEANNQLVKNVHSNIGMLNRLDIEMNYATTQKY